MREALPGAADPALEGPALLPAAAFKLHGVRPSELRDRERGRGGMSGRVRRRLEACRAARGAALLRVLLRTALPPWLQEYLHKAPTPLAPAPPHRTTPARQLLP